MKAIAQLFRKSPFSALHRHMSLVMECVGMVDTLFDHLGKKNWDALHTEIRKLSKMEHEADLIQRKLLKVQRGLRVHCSPRNTPPQSIV